MDGYARIRISTDFTQVRFEQIDSRNSFHSFDRLRDDFYCSIPSAQWNQKIRWMVIPNKDLRKVLDFCYARFGVNKVDVIQETENLPKPKQLFRGFAQIQEGK